MSDGAAVQTHPSSKAHPGSGNGGNGTDTRLRAVENRLTAIETELRHIARKKDLETLKVWMLVTLLGGIGAAATIVRLIGP